MGEVVALRRAGREARISKREVAVLMGCSVRTVETRMKQGLPYEKRTPHGMVRFVPSAVEAWMRGES